MSEDRNDTPDDTPPNPASRDKKHQNSFLALGIVFVALGIGMSFGDSSTWIVFIVLGITFLAVSATPMVKKKGTKGKRPRAD